MSIILFTDDLPLSVTPMEAAALVLGTERVANDNIMIVVHSETELTYAWQASMRERLVTDPTPEVEQIVREMDDLLTSDPMNRAGPPVSPQAAVSLLAPADSSSVATAPLKHQSPDYRGLTLESMKSDAQRRGLQLTDTGNGFRLANKHGSLVRKTLAELVDFIRSADSGATRVEPQEEAAN